MADAENEQGAEVDLTGAEKVTALLLAMSKENADRIIRLFDESEIRVVARSASELPAISLDRLEEVISELSDELAVEKGLIGSPEHAEQLLAGVVPDEQAVEIISDLRGESGLLVWGKLEAMPSAELVEMLADEHPQAAAVVLDRLDTERAAATLDLMTSERRIELSRRMLSLRKPSDAAIRMIENRLKEKLQANSQKPETSDSDVRLSAVLNNLDREHADEVLRGIEESHPDEISSIRKRMFRFDQITKLTQEDRVRLFDPIPSETVILALRQAEDDLKECVLASVSARSRRLMEQELDVAMRVTPEAVLEAQRGIARKALEMIQAGEITFEATED
ncbi:MAG: FliG C-terminal domain-containing protein [Pseudomonadota bacterium]